jgi:tetratricopeptide (TPR) repeat protein
VSGVVFAVALSFYTNLLARGQADAVAHNDARAAEELRVASFGLLDDVALYESAQMNLAVVLNRLGRKDEARYAASRVAHAEKMQPGAGAPVDPAIRAEFEKIQNADVERALSPSTPPRRAESPSYVSHVDDDLMQRALAARQLLADGDTIGAQNLAEGIIARDINNGPAQAVLGVIAARAKEWSDAADHFAIARTSVRLTPEETAAYNETLSHLSPLVAAAKTQPSQSPVMADYSAKLNEAESLRRSGRSNAARQIYESLAAIPDLRRDVLLQVAQGLSLTFAWRESSAAYHRTFPLLKGEEIHMFDEAVNRYELGDLQMARELLQKALPALPETPEVILYRGKILGKR